MSVIGGAGDTSVTTAKVHGCSGLWHYRIWERVRHDGDNQTLEDPE